MMKTLTKSGREMNPVTRLAVAALLAVSLTLFAKPPPQGEDWGSIPLANTGAEPRASGVATLNNVTSGLIWYNEVQFQRSYHGTLTVECQNLTPGARYSTPAGTFKADRRGNGKATGDVSFVIGWEISWWGDMIIWGDLVMPYEVEVVRLDPSGPSTPVLSGLFVPPE